MLSLSRKQGRMWTSALPGNEAPEDLILLAAAGKTAAVGKFGVEIGGNKNTLLGDQDLATTFQMNVRTAVIGHVAAVDGDAAARGEGEHGEGDDDLFHGDDSFYFLSVFEARWAVKDVVAAAGSPLRRAWSQAWQRVRVARKGEIDSTAGSKAVEILTAASQVAA